MSHWTDLLHYLPRSGSWVAAWLPMPGGWEEGTEIRLASDENLSMCFSFSRREETLRKCLLFVSDSGSTGIDPYAVADALPEPWLKVPSNLCSSCSFIVRAVYIAWPVNKMGTFGDHSNVA